MEVQNQIREILEGVKQNKPLLSKDPDISKAIKVLEKDKLILFKGQGCDACGQTGYKGRIGIFELLEMTERIAHLTVENSPADTIERAAVEEGMLLLNQDGYLRALEGVTTVEEVMRVANL
jgi:type IV pilus assembly protein PilB